MDIYSKLEKHLPREKRINCCDLAETDDGYRKQGFNHCKAQYDEVLKRVVVDEEALARRLMFPSDTNKEFNVNFGVINHSKAFQLAHAIANSPDVIKVSTHNNEQGG